MSTEAGEAISGVLEPLPRHLDSQIDSSHFDLFSFVSRLRKKGTAREQLCAELRDDVNTSPVEPHSHFTTTSIHHGWSS
jgi:hypothetical protein